MLKGHTHPSFNPFPLCHFIHPHTKPVRWTSQPSPRFSLETQAGEVTSPWVCRQYQLMTSAIYTHPASHVPCSPKVTFSQAHLHFFQTAENKEQNLRFNKFWVGKEAWPACSWSAWAPQHVSDSWQSKASQTSAWAVICLCRRESVTHLWKMELEFVIHLVCICDLGFWTTKACILKLYAFEVLNEEAQT